MKISKSRIWKWMGIITLLIVIADIILLLTKNPTISATTLYYTFNKRWVIAPLFIGVLSGHLFLPSALNIIKKWYLLPIIAILLITISQVIMSLTRISPLFFLVVGFSAGALLWNQKLENKEQA